MNSPQSKEQDPLRDRLKENARALFQPPSKTHQEQTLELIRKEFDTKPAQIIAFPSLTPLFAVAAAIALVASVFIFQYQNNVDSPELVVSPEVMKQSLKEISDLQNIPDPTELTASLTSVPMLDELSAIAEELTATFQDILELMEAS